MKALLLDAGPLIAVDRGDRTVLTRVDEAKQGGFTPRTSAIVIAQAWRDPRGRQAALARLLGDVDVVPVDERRARAAGILLGRAGTSDAVDASLVILAETGDRILTSDPDDMRRLAAAAGVSVGVVEV